MGSEMGGSFGPELGFACSFGGFVWHPASSVVAITKKKPHENISTNKISVNIRVKVT